MRCATLLILLAAISFVSAECSEYDKCNFCLVLDGCGWSKAQDACLAGANTSSLDNSSSGDDWVWDDMLQCPESTCTTYPSCTRCTSLIVAGCGWSVSQNQCMLGNETDSLDNSSSGDDWIYYPDECIDDECNTHSTCVLCKLDAVCGWSVSQSRCLRGNGSGSFDNSSSGSDWVWELGTACPNPSASPSLQSSPTISASPSPIQPATPSGGCLSSFLLPLLFAGIFVLSRR